jgi:chromosome segregation ATPase
MTNSIVQRRGWQRRVPVDAESEWEAFLSSKKDAMNRMKAGRQEALRRLGSDKMGGRSVVSELSDEREAAESLKDNYSVSGRSEMRDAPEGGNRDNPAMSSHSRTDLDMRKLIEIFTVIKKRRWDDLLELIQLYPQSPSIPCPKNIQSTAKGNMMLHEVCRNSPPTEVVSALIVEFADAVKAKGGKGYLPLHYACATSASTEVVRKLLDTFPASIRMRDTNDLMIPLHFACKWGASSEIIEVLVGAYPEGKQVRDIYAKTPVDYASELRGQDRSGVVAALERSSHSRYSERSFVRSVGGSEASSINLNDAVSVSSKHVQQEMRSTKMKLEKVTSELNDRERKFSTLYGAEKSKASELQKQNDMLEHECMQARVAQDEHKKKMELLQQEVRTLKSLQETHSQKKTMLMEKIQMLEREKMTARDAIGKIDHKNSARIKHELTAAMVEQEIKYKSMLQSELRKIENLEKQSREAELTHRHYTMALLQEHENEVTRFEELTSRFKVLEGQLRREIENERTKRLAAQNGSSARGSNYKQAIEHEKEKVAFLEGHITKVNNLLEAEQKRFIELECILKETLAIENEQREEIEAEFREKESQYQSRIEIETQKRNQLEEAYTDVAQKLKSEIEKSSGLQAYEAELKKELKMDQEKILELQRLQVESAKILEAERQRVKKMEVTEADSRLLLKTEELKVNELEESLKEMRHLLNVERESVKQLRNELNQLQAVHDREMKKINLIEEAESSARSELRSINQNVASLEGEESAIKKKTEDESSKLNSFEEECFKLKSMLESERDQVQRLNQSQEELRELLCEEKKRVKSLEKDQVLTETEMEEMNSEDMSQASSIEEKLMETQATIDHHRHRVSALEGKHNLLTKALETEKESSQRLERTVQEKEVQLESEREKFEVLLKEHQEVRLALNGERNKAKTIEQKAVTYETQLEFERGSMMDMQRMVDQAKVDFQSKLEEVTSLEEEEEVSRHVLDASLKELNISNDEVAQLTESLKVENNKVAEMAAGLKDVQNLLRDEKYRVVEYERLLEAQKHLSMADQLKIRQLEQEVEEQLANLELGTAENSKLETDLSETQSLLDNEAKKVAELLDTGHNFDGSRATVLLESEQNKVKALEHSCEQLMSLLDWEKNHVLSLEEKQDELQEQNDSSEEEVATTKEALEKSQKKVESLTVQLDGFEDMKNEIIRLTLVARQRDIMIAAILHAIGEAKAIKGKAPVQNAEMYLDELQGRIGNLDLAGLDQDVLKDREARQLVLYTVAARRRTLRNVVLPLLPISGLIAYHHHDPTALRELSSNLGEMSADLRSNLGEFSHNLGDLSASFSATLSTNIGQLASRMADSPSLREPVAHVVGMASRRMNIRQV